MGHILIIIYHISDCMRPHGAWQFDEAVFQWQASTTFWNYSEVLLTGFSMRIDEKVPKRCEIPQICMDVIYAKFVAIVVMFIFSNGISQLSDEI